MSAAPATSPAKAGPPLVKSVLLAVFALVLLLLPVGAQMVEAPYYVILVSRLMVFALAAAALNLVLGYGGMVSFGHSLFIGLGAYCVAIPGYYGISSGWAHLAFTVLVSAAVAAATGAVALRTRGVAFIMITLAFGQMFYFLVVSLKEYGGDDGLRIAAGSRFGPLHLEDPRTLYYVALAVLAATLYGTSRLVRSRFGLVLRGCMVNEDRMKALGYPTHRYKLVAYMISGVIAGLSGLLLANLTLFAAPAYASWTVSGDLMIMVVLGGTGTVAGPAVGAFAFLVIEDVLKRLTDHWLGAVGLVIVLLSLLVRRGVWGSLERDKA